MLAEIILHPDRILSMVGGSNIGTELGKETEGKVHGLFVQAGGGTTKLAGAGVAAKVAREKAAQTAAAAGNGQTNPSTPGNRT